MPDATEPWDLLAALEASAHRSNQLAENLVAGMAGWSMPDGTPITEHTIGDLMAQHHGAWLEVAVTTPWVDPGMPS